MELSQEEKSRNKRQRTEVHEDSADVLRLRELVQDGTFVHPLGRSFNFCDLAHAVALCCGLSPENPVRIKEATDLAQQLGGTQTKHLVLVLCDGMGNNVIDQHLPPSSFLATHNNPAFLTTVFPATTPAVLTSLATGAWPGQHGQPGWDLRDQKQVEYPCTPGSGVVQIRCLIKEMADMRSNKPISEFGFTDKDVFVAAPWTMGQSPRKMHFVNAYNGTGFTKWYQGPHNGNLANFPETVSSTLGTPEGSTTAVANFTQAVDEVLRGVREAETKGWQTYTYLYCAHPDKHMHALGMEHSEVTKVMEGIDAQLQRLWSTMEQEALDVSLLVTADHGHITVRPKDMISLPADLLELLEYANIGASGKGRHAVLHVRTGLVPLFKSRWAAHERLCEAFVLLSIEEAAQEGIFGPSFSVRQEVRPRLGDLIAISVGPGTLVTPQDAEVYRDCPYPKEHGSHGSLAAAEMRVPYVLCRASNPN
jgi:hypothetical protein